MKNLQLATLALLLFGTAAHAKSVPAQIAYLNCASLNAVSGATTVVFAGSFGGDTYLNISNVSYGLPFTQQARIVEASMVSRETLRLKLQPMITGGVLYLELKSGTTQGLLTESPGDNTGIPMMCSSQIN